MKHSNMNQIIFPRACNPRYSNRNVNAKPNNNFNCNAIKSERTILIKKHGWDVFNKSLYAVCCKTNLKVMSLFMIVPYPISKREKLIHRNTA